MRRPWVKGVAGVTFAAIVAGTVGAEGPLTTDASNLLRLGEEARGTPGAIRDWDRDWRNMVAEGATEESQQAVTQAAKAVEVRWKEIHEDMARLREADARAMEKHAKRRRWVRALRIVSATANAAAAVGRAAEAHRAQSAAQKEAKAHAAAEFADVAAEIVQASSGPEAALEVQGDDAGYVVGIELHGEREGEAERSAVGAYLGETLHGSQCGGDGVCRSPAFVETGFDAAMLAVSARDVYEAYKPGSEASIEERWLATAALTADAVAVALPGVPAVGGRTIMRIARIGNKVRDKFPRRFVGKFTDKHDSLYQSGVKWTDPMNPHNSVRIMFGNPKSQWPNSRHTYVRVQRDGKALDRHGRTLTSPEMEAAHIPIEDFLKHFPEGIKLWDE